MENEDEIFDAAVTPDGQHCLTAGRPGFVRIWDIRLGKPVGPPIATGASRWKMDAYNVEISPDGGRAVVGTDLELDVIDLGDLHASEARPGPTRAARRTRHGIPRGRGQPRPADLAGVAGPLARPPSAASGFALVARMNADPAASRPSGLDRTRIPGPGSKELGLGRPDRLIGKCLLHEADHEAGAAPARDRRPANAP